MALVSDDPAEYLRQLRSATEDLVRAIAVLSDAAVRAASPLPGWTRGIVPSRLGEVLIHHVDLDIGHRPSDWPAAFVSDFLERAMRGLRTREKIVGAIRLEGADTGRVFVVGEIASASPVVAGPEYALAAWLLGRSDGSDLSCEGAAGLPVVPAFYPV